jgi:uncharacterized protein YycO
VKKITFHFFSGSPLIKLRFGTPITHVGVEFDDGTFYESLMTRGNVKHRLENRKDKPKYSITIEVSDAKAILARDVANRIHGRPYDYLAIAGFILGTKTQGVESFFCSELGRLVFEEATGSRIKLERLCTPYDLYLMVSTYASI